MNAFGNIAAGLVGKQYNALFSLNTAARKLWIKQQWVLIAGPYQRHFLQMAFEPHTQMEFLRMLFRSGLHYFTENMLEAEILVKMGSSALYKEPHPADGTKPHEVPSEDYLGALLETFSALLRSAAEVEEKGGSRAAVKAMRNAAVGEMSSPSWDLRKKMEAIGKTIRIWTSKRGLNKASKWATALQPYLVALAPRRAESVTEVASFTPAAPATNPPDAPAVKNPEQNDILQFKS